MSLSAVFKYMAKQSVDCRNMVRVKVWHALPHHCLVTQKLQSTYFNVLYTYFIIGRMAFNDRATADLELR